MNYKKGGIMEVLVLDIKSKFGVFNKPYSTTGGLLTYRIPPKPTVIGLLGAIIGLSFEESLALFSDVKIGIKPLNPINYTSVVFNCHYGGRKNRMVNVRQQILIEPHYRVYIDFRNTSDDDRYLNKISKILKRNNINDKPNNIFSSLEKILKNGISYYSLYMGRNDFPLQYELQDHNLDIISSQEDKFYNSDSVVPHNACEDFQVEEVSDEPKRSFGLNINEPNSLKFHILRDFPIDQNEDREYTNTEDLVMKSISKSINLKVKLDLSQDKYRHYLDESDKLVTVF